ncbi:hypothetical protein RMA73_04785 [Xanthomonas translucens pv. translucens]|uniref:hypothetical protein n=1 Tax=Xanthomonas campestris pv. translucens TaxID=343 RepID=UPI000AD8758D|nr:hypothetical protein [Xanthomonas translucens]MCC8445114.1 hypothetical protein [Xanthomonas translucens pv. translucens]MCT8284750.1 hypothetical protein [Xanthomonas translucens pv. translucens]MCT8302408.1 hypothetical protein [Xanthomonas translucens pv. translucens]QSQ29673.1 hypothetical protein ISN30_15600 [Xanthomonas translucens pv. translucens]UNU12127.1 hypothetical protein KBV71_04905 [Xanthomonas translucens pv. translucens]
MFIVALETVAPLRRPGYVRRMISMSALRPIIANGRNNALANNRARPMRVCD